MLHNEFQLRMDDKPPQDLSMYGIFTYEFTIQIKQM